tara:strand:+ start:11912 stop:12796 length:885 start_codon:yes stop_codon:yes gene_type:complete
MASSYVSSFLRQQGLEKEKNKNLEKVFAKQAADELLGQVAHMNTARGTKRRGMSAVSESRGADASADIEVRKYAHEETVEIAEQQQVLGWITAASGAAGTLMAFYAKKLDEDAKKEKEAASIAEAESSEEAAMLTDHRQEGEEYSPSMLRDPGDPVVDELIRDEFEPMYDPDGQLFQGQVDASTGGSQINPSSTVYKGGMNATEFKAARDSRRAEKAAESLILDEKQAAAADSSREFTKEQSLLDSQRMGRKKAPTAEQLYGPGWRKRVRDAMTEEDKKRLDSNWLEYLDMGAE